MSDRWLCSFAKYLIFRNRDGKFRPLFQIKQIISIFYYLCALF